MLRVPATKTTPRKPDGYAGEIVRWRDNETKQIAAYGSVTNTGDTTHAPMTK
jgi:hypothetical protein